MQETLSPSQAAEVAGVSEASVLSWARSKALRSEKVGRSIVIAKEDLELVMSLRKEHGTHRWAAHVPWREEFEEETEDAPKVPTLAEKMVTKAKELRAAGNHEMAGVLFELLVDEFDWSTV